MIQRISAKRNRSRGESGFTLIELLVVIIILGILSAVVVFAIRGAGDRGAAAALASDARALRTAEELTCGKSGGYAGQKQMVDGRFLSEESTLNNVSVYVVAPGANPPGPRCQGTGGLGSASLTGTGADQRLGYPGATSYEIQCNTGAPGCGAPGSGTTPMRIGNVTYSSLLNNDPSRAADCATTESGPCGGGPGDDGYNFGNTVVAAGADLNGDQVNDLWASGDYWTPSFDGDWTAIYALDGAALAQGDTTVLYRIDACDGDDAAPPYACNSDTSSAIGYPGNPNSVPPTTNSDPNGDGIPDLAVGDDLNSYPGYATVFNGQNGDPLFVIPPPVSDPGQACFTNPGCPVSFGAQVSDAGDIDKDGTEDIMVSAPGFGSNQGRVYIYSGKPSDHNPADPVETRGLIRVLDAPAGCTPFCGFGQSLSTPGDVNRDGWADQLVGASSGGGRLFLLSGSDGTPLMQIKKPYPNANGTFGLQVVQRNSPGDLTGDLWPDLYGAAYSMPGPTAGADGRAFVFDSQATYALQNTAPDAAANKAAGKAVIKYEILDPSPSNKTWGYSMSSGDADGDGIGDLFIGRGANSQGSVTLVDGATGRTVNLTPRQYVLTPAANPDDLQCADEAGIGRYVVAPGDLNGDGKAEFVTGMPKYTRRCDVDAYIFGQGALLTFKSSVLP